MDIEQATAIMDGKFGLFVGLLTDNEIAAFDVLCEAGLARRVYRGAGGFMGLATAERITNTRTGSADSSSLRTTGAGGAIPLPVSPATLPQGADCAASRTCLQSVRAFSSRVA